MRQETFLNPAYTSTASNRMNPPCLLETTGANSGVTNNGEILSA
jgi:hypothetical protein